MKRAAPSLAVIASLALFVGWTQNNQSDWLKGIIYAGSGKVQLTDATGNLVTAGNISTTGNVAIGGTLAVTGATTLRSTLAVTGAETVGGALTVTGNEALTGTLAVTGATTLRSTLSVSGTSTLSGALTAPTGTFTGPLTGTSATLSSTLDVTGAASFSSSTFKLSSVGTYVATGTTQGNAIAITTVFAGITGPTAVAGAVLPAAATGLVEVVGNTNASIALKLYPASGDAINNSSANTAITVSAGKSYMCGALDATTWLCAGN